MPVLDRKSHSVLYPLVDHSRVDLWLVSYFLDLDHPFGELHRLAAVEALAAEVVVLTEPALMEGKETVMQTQWIRTPLDLTLCSGHEHDWQARLPGLSPEEGPWWVEDQTEAEDLLRGQPYSRESH